MLKIKISTHIFLTCLAALLYAPIASTECAQQTTTEIRSCRPAASAPCYVVGGHSEICSSEPAMRIAVNEWRLEYQCYVGHGICERNASGQCEWRCTEGLSQCITDMRNRIPESVEPCSQAKNCTPVACPPKKP